MAIQQAYTLSSIPDELSRGTGSFKTRKSLPHPELHTEQRKVLGFINGDHVNASPISARRASGASMPGSFPMNGFDSSLPPTPPRHTHDLSRTVSSTSRPPRQNGTHEALRRSSNYHSPIGARSPPTPDATPPTTASLELPVRPALPAFSPSSRADSFRTAREEQSSSEDEADDDHIRNTIGGAVKPVKQTSHDLGLGLDFERDDDPTPTPKKQAAARNETGRSQLDGTDQFRTAAIPNREWDTNMMRNVTVRRKKRPILPQNEVEEDEERVAARDIVPKLVNGSSEDDEGPEPLTPGNDHFAQTMPGAQRPDERLKRYSGSSHTSTALEAIIIPSSPQRRRTLRHVSKNLSLRSDDGSSRPSSNHASLASDDLSMSQLNDKLRLEHTNRMNGIYTPDPSSMVPAVALKHHPVRKSLRLDSVSSVNSGYRRASDGSQNTSPPSKPYRTFSGSDSINGINEIENPRRLSYQPGPEAIHVKYNAAAKLPSRGPGSTSEQQSLTRAATRKALQRLDSTGGTADARPSSSPREAPQTRSATTSIVQVSQKEDAKPADEANEPSTRSVLKSKRKDSIELPSLEQHPTVESVPRVSFDKSTIESHEMHRASNASSNLRADSEHANARHLYAQSTPFSQISEHEMGEATAVSIYPHNNNSLLVVQQVARPSVVQKESDETAPIPGWPTLTIQPATPPLPFSSLSNPMNVDSPLKNPRRPPQPPQPSLVPPVINILPATPENELDRMSFNEQNTASDIDPPARSLSLVQRAKRYSEDIMRPMIIRSSSLRQSYYRHSRSLRHSAPRDSTREFKSTATNLHPFWQPRGFWDEFSDSDSDWGEPEPGSARLPAGGDTSDVGEPRGIAKMLDKTRFSRGFIVGNSHGLERAGTNKNKPFIELPVGLGRRTSGRVIMKRTSQGTVHSITSESIRSAKIAKRSIESLRQLSDNSGRSKQAWNPRNWQVKYVGVNGVRKMWRQRQAEKRRQELKGKIGIRYSVENAPTSN
jgi:hypothetical protein